MIVYLRQKNPMNVVNIQDKLDLFSDHWHPRIIAELNGQAVKIAKVKGDFIWHDHKDEDELFFVIKGTLYIEFREETKTIREGELLVVPKGVEHRPYAPEEVSLMLFEPMQTKHTGEVNHEMTKSQLESI